MARLVTKFKYLKPNGKQRAGGYAKYIATREGAEKIDESFRFAPATKKQAQLIRKILKDFPDTKEMHEYADYTKEPDAGNASDFISRAIEDNAEVAAGRKTYADYIATRPRAERFGSHGLFTDDGVEVRLDAVSEELNRHNGNVWTVILSLRREDAERLGFAEGKRWRDMLRSHTDELAKNFKIPIEHLHWYAAFHNESHHPHVHLIVYSDMENEGYLTERGVQNLRSAFARDIFAQDLLSVYEEQTKNRDKLKKESGERIDEIVRQINKEGCNDPYLEEILVRLADRLSKTKGKKIYGYLKSDVKALVRSAVDEIAKDARIAELYNLWYGQRESIIRTYTETLSPRVLLSENDAFKSVRGMVIQAAMDIVRGDTDVGTDLEDDLPDEEPTDGETEQRYLPNFKTTWELYFWAKDLLDKCGENYDPHRAVRLLETCAKRGNMVAKYRLGKMYLKGDGVEQDIASALRFLTEAAEEGNEYAEYLLGKMYLKGEGIGRDLIKAEEYLRRSAGRGNKYAAYRLGKALQDGELVPRDVGEAERFLKASAEQGFAPAQNVLGKAYYRGDMTERDLKKALGYLERVAEKYPNAAYLVGMIYLSEEESDPEKAVRYFRSAAEKGNAFAEYQLGRLYFFGKGVPRDEDAGMAYLKSAAARGNERAERLIISIQSNRNYMAAVGAARLFQSIAYLLQSRSEHDRQNGIGRADKKLRRAIEEKKQAHGLKQE